MVEQRSPKPRAEGSSPSAPATSEWTSLHSDFSLQKNQSYASSFLLYRKRSHSRRLFGCKRPHNAFGSLPTFCECACGANISMVRLFHVGASFISLALIFFVKIRVRSCRCSFSFAKRHARLNCSLVNAFATFHCRYHLFASVPAAQRKY